ncbi:MAG: peptide chain release factor N(5)-glutamine methyltransferase [Clostridia bacterium]|nr:peptide chain release factor N(5)-glutamine methyltransferase [Clostridia bacterium]
MTYKQLHDDIKKRLKDDAGAYCFYLLDKPLPLIGFDEGDVPEETERAHAAYSERIISGEPLQYVFGYTYFYGLRLDCSPGVLIPRPDTEILVEEAVKTLPRNAFFADLCCGSGCIAAAVLSARPDTEALCLDISDKALDLTETNLKKCGCSGRAEIKRFDVFGGWDGLPTLDCILCNPPYINAADMEKLPENVRREPETALYGGKDGLDFYRRIISASEGRFNSGTHIIFEIGYDQGDALRGLCPGCVIKKDYSGNDRICIIDKRSQ